MPATLYETDLYAWSQRQVELLRAEDFADVDWDNVIEEIDSVGASQRNELKSRLKELIMHLLKWQFEPESSCTVGMHRSLCSATRCMTSWTTTPVCAD